MAKVKKKKLKSVRGIDFRRTTRRSVPQPYYLKTPTIEKSAKEERIDEIAREIGGPEAQKVAAQVWNLFQKYPGATLPEMVTMEWLDREGQPYEFQVPVSGGHKKGGVVPDFMIPNGSGADIWLIQGDYFHSAEFQARYRQEGRDALAKMRLLGQTIKGRKILRVVELEESDIYKLRPQIFRDALAGISKS